MLRRVRGPGHEPGQQPGDQEGALARGAGPMKPAKPTNRHSTAGGKDIWGHLPAELQQLMEATFKEQSLTAKAELISRYFLSVEQRNARSWRSEVMVDKQTRPVRAPGSVRRWLMPAAMFCATVAVAARAQEPPKSVKGFGEAQRGDVPEGTAEMMTPRNRRGHHQRSGMAGSDSERRWLIRRRHVSRQHRGNQRGWPGVHGVGIESRARSIRSADR